MFRSFSIVLLLTLTVAVASPLLMQGLQQEAIIRIGHPADLDVVAVEVTAFSCGASQVLRKQAGERERSDGALYDFHVKLCGEGSHQARLILADGRVLFGPGNSYIESGRTITDIGPFRSAPPESRRAWPADSDARSPGRSVAGAALESDASVSR